MENIKFTKGKIRICKDSITDCPKCGMKMKGYDEETDSGLMYVLECPKCNYKKLIDYA